jgi:diguanylate cyclase (GGDEF)-like protein
MAVTPEFLLVLLGANLLVGLAIGWIAHAFAHSAPEPLGKSSPPQQGVKVNHDELLEEISRKTTSCSEELRRYGEELESVDDDGQAALIDRIKNSGAAYEESLNADVARFSDVTSHGDAVLRHVLIELIKHTGHVQKFTRTLDEEVAPRVPDDIKVALGLAISELINANRKLEGELHSARRDIERQREQLAEVQREARIDGLTRIANRRYFNERLEAVHARHQRSGESYAVAVLDLDHFKDLNDTYGHAAGDAALRVFARILEDCIRKYDTPARIGGEEFAVILDSTGGREARIIAERIRARTASVKVHYHGQEIQFTTSIGVAVVRDGEETDMVLHRADAALYNAKHAGRDRVALAWDDESTADAETPEMAPVA